MEKHTEETSRKSGQKHYKSARTLPSTSKKVDLEFAASQSLQFLLSDALPCNCAPGANAQREGC